MESGLVVIVVAACLIGVVAIARLKKKDQAPQDSVGGGAGNGVVETHALKEMPAETVAPVAKKKPGRKPSAKKAIAKKQK